MTTLSLVGLIALAACDDSGGDKQSTTTKPETTTETQTPVDPCASKPSAVERTLCANEELAKLNQQVDEKQARDSLLQNDVARCESSEQIVTCLEVAYRLAIGRKEAAATTQNNGSTNTGTENTDKTVGEAVQETVNDTVNTTTEAVQDQVNETVNDAINQVLENDGQTDEAGDEAGADVNGQTNTQPEN